MRRDRAKHAYAALLSAVALLDVAASGVIGSSQPVMATQSKPTTPRITIKPQAASGSSILSVSTPGGLLWQAQIWDSRVGVFPSLHRVVYLAGGQRLMARGLDGAHAAKLATLDGTGIAGLTVGGSALILTQTGPTWGVGFFDLNAWPGIWRRRPVTAVDVANARTLWHRNVARVGWVRWTDGSIFLSVRPNLSTRALRRAQRSNGWLPCRVEVRRLSDARLLWRRTRAGDPGQVASVRVAGRGRMVFRFQGGSLASTRFIRQLAPSTLVAHVPGYRPKHAVEAYVIRGEASKP